MLAFISQYNLNLDARSLIFWQSSRLDNPNPNPTLHIII